MFDWTINAKLKRAELAKMAPNSVSLQSHDLGMKNDEPLIVMMDCLFQYASAYKTRHEQPLSEDYVLGAEWLKAAVGVRGLLNGDGAHAMKVGRSTDSKDNGTVESMFWDAMAAAGFKEEDI